LITEDGVKLPSQRTQKYYRKSSGRPPVLSERDQRNINREASNKMFPLPKSALTSNLTSHDRPFGELYHLIRKKMLRKAKLTPAAIEQRHDMCLLTNIPVDK
jgi:hypothetical protein